MEDMTVTGAKREMELASLSAVGIIRLVAVPLLPQLDCGLRRREHMISWGMTAMTFADQMARAEQSRADQTESEARMHTA